METRYEFREFYIPLRMMEGINNYLKNRIMPGDFLVGIITNDLRMACGHADEENLRNIPAYVSYFYNFTPSVCWGSKERMDEWLSGKWSSLKFDQEGGDSR